ncbi:hypothetical protein ACHAXH_007804 [Discostella pseudostelligera]
MVLSILERMNPAECLGGRLSLIYDTPKETNDIRAPLLDNNEKDPNTIILQSLQQSVPDLLECITNVMLLHDTEKENRGDSIINCTAALQKLHDLTTKECEQNRIPLVCNTTEQWDVVGVLSNALLASTITAEAGVEETNTPSKKSKGGGKPSVDENRRLILWTLNNLSIPYENKASMALGSNSTKLLQALTKIMELNLPESYLCCICLLNLTFYGNVIRNVALFLPPPLPQSLNKMRLARSQTLACSSHKTSSPNSTDNNTSVHHSRVRSLDMTTTRPLSGKKKFTFGSIAEGGEDGGKRISNALGNSSSLIRVVEQMMLVNTPYLLTSVRSVQGEVIRWSCGFIRNVTYVGGGGGVGGEINNGIVDSGSPTQGALPNEEPNEEICLLLSQTEIPRLMAQYVKDSPRPIIEWTKDSLEDMCLGAMCNMAQWQSTRDALWRAGAFHSLKKLEECPGIHGYRARAIRCSLGVLQSRFR